jgi:putative membrane protein
MLLNKRISIGYFVRQIKYQIILIVFFAFLIGFLDDISLFKKYLFH